MQPHRLKINTMKMVAQSQARLTHGVKIDNSNGVELGCCVQFKTPKPRLDPQKNQNGSMAKDAFFMETYISAECARPDVIVH